MHLLFTLRPVTGLFVVFMVVSVLAACGKGAPPPEPVRAVKTMVIGEQGQSAVQTFAAQAQARTESRLGFQVAGKLLERPVQLGERVRPGQLLARLDAQDYALAEQAAQAQVAAARTQRDLAQADVQRYTTLQSQGFISAVELDRRQAQLRSAQAQLDQALAQAAAQSNQRRYTQLLAGAAGVVTGVMAEPGQVVAAGAPVVQLAHDGVRDAVFAVAEDVLPQIQVGQPVQVRAWEQAGQWPGVIREVAASADPITRTYAVRAQLQGEGQPALGATLQVQWNAPAQAQTSHWLLPATAVWHQQAQSWVWRVQGAAPELRVQAQQVQVLGVQGNALQVQGLQAGDRVVVAGTHVLTEGQAVTLYAPRHPDAAQ